MKIIELYKGPYARISRAEAEAVCGKSGDLKGDYLIIDTDLEQLHQRLGYCRFVGDLGFCSKGTPELSTISSLITGPYEFRFTQVDSSLKTQILNYTTQISHPVELDHPATTMLFIGVDDELLCIVNPQENTDRFDDRRMHLNPAPHPSSLSPRLARAMINLTGIEQGEIYDPFCGAGGLLIEGAKIGLEMVGKDIDPIQIKRAKLNLDHHHVTATLIEGDSCKDHTSYDYIVTDIAYGKNTKGESELIDTFLRLLATILPKKAVIGLPSHYDYGSVLHNISSLKLTDEFDHYLHKSLSKKIIVVEKVNLSS